MKIEQSSLENILTNLKIQGNDTILYLGGRIDDDNLYPFGYRQYLNEKIKKLNPDKIICHNHWYAKKYYERGILSNDTKIDMIFAYYYYVVSGKLQMIRPEDYSDHRKWMKNLIDKNPKIIYTLYISEGAKPPSIDVDTKWFTSDYNLNNVKYLCVNRKYSPDNLTGDELGHGNHIRNASDGFTMIINLLNQGLKNINILGFSAFGSNEDMSYHSVYQSAGDTRFAGRKLFDLVTSEDLPAESDILKYWVKTKKIHNLEDHNKLLSFLGENE